jgi:predicted ArsR family transcriptional regulator
MGAAVLERGAATPDSSGSVPRGHGDSEHGPHGEGGTRTAVARLLLEHGPVAATVVADTLALSAPAVRRHLDALVADGEVDVRDARRRSPRRRGRPAKEYLLTDAGRARFGHGYDDLAVSALRHLAAYGGEHAIRKFAEHRTAELLAPVDEVAGPDDAAARVEALARRLSARGYAAQSTRVGSGVQLCQHHCPVAHVAAAFPELCEAETAAFAEVLGTHVQRLATIARGDAACTTHVPLGTPEPPRAASTTTDGPPPPAGQTGRQFA